MKLLDLLVDMSKHGDIQTMDPDGCCYSCGSNFLYGKGHDIDCRMIKLFKFINDRQKEKSEKQNQLDKYNKEKLARMNAEITGIVEVYHHENGWEFLCDELDDCIGELVEISHYSGDTFSIDEFQNGYIDHEFISYRVTKDNFEFLSPPT